VDVSQIPKYLTYLVDNKVDGLYICGTTGEGYSLTNDEKIAIVKAWRQAIDTQKANHLLAVVNVSSTCLKESLLLSKHVESLGFDAIAVLPPIYYKPTTVDEWVNYMKAFGRAAPTIPLYYYHNARRVGELSCK
jgi:N-acetylneuraminate lyase